MSRHAQDSPYPIKKIKKNYLAPNIKRAEAQESCSRIKALWIPMAVPERCRGPSPAEPCELKTCWKVLHPRTLGGMTNEPGAQPLYSSRAGPKDRFGCHDATVSTKGTWTGGQRSVERLWGRSGQQLLLESGPHRKEQCPQNASRATETAEPAGRAGVGNGHLKGTSKNGIVWVPWSPHAGKADDWGLKIPGEEKPPEACLAAWDWVWPLGSLGVVRAGIPKPPDRIAGWGKLQWWSLACRLQMCQALALESDCSSLSLSFPIWKMCLILVLSSQGCENEIRWWLKLSGQCLSHEL